MAKSAVDELLRTVRWSAAGARPDWPGLESAVDARFPTEFRDLVESLPPGQFQVPLSILHPAVYEDPESYAEEVAGYANLLREDAGRTKFPYPIYPDAGGVLPWGVVGFDFIVCLPWKPPALAVGRKRNPAEWVRDSPSAVKADGRHRERLARRCAGFRHIA